MSLEIEIKKLTEAVTALTEQLKRQVVTPTTPPTPKAEAPKADKPKPKVETPKDDSPTAESLQNLCMDIVKADRSKRDEIKSIIATFDGATTIKGVAANRLAELKTMLEGLL